MSQSQWVKLINQIGLVREQILRIGFINWWLIEKIRFKRIVLSQIGHFFSNDKGAIQDSQFKLFVHKSVICLPKTCNILYESFGLLLWHFYDFKFFVNASYGNHNTVQGIHLTFKESESYVWHCMRMSFNFWVNYTLKYYKYLLYGET